MKSSFNRHWIALVALPVAFVLSCTTGNREMAESTDTENDTAVIVEQRQLEDSTAFAQLNAYDGTYDIQTESDGVNSKLELKYNANRTFNYKWNFDVSVDEAECHGNREGIVAMDKTQHGVDANGDCVIHFNFSVDEAEGYVVEVAFADQALCKDLKGECIFSGTYMQK